MLFSVVGGAEKTARAEARGCIFRALTAVFWAALLLGQSPLATAQVGATFESLPTPAGVFATVKVLSVSPSAITIRHAGGLAQVPLKTLSPELQAQFDYDPEKAAAHEQKMAQDAQAQADAVRQREDTEREARRLIGRGSLRPGETPISRAMARFGTTATIQTVDLRPVFRALELQTKNQGLRPSCTVYAMVGALEFENAKLVGKPEKLSEEYLIWATRRTIGLGPGQKRDSPGRDGEENSDAGFSLMEALAAVRAFGVPLQSEMPPTYRVDMEAIPEPSAEVIASARSRRWVYTHSIPGHDMGTVIQNLLHVLNEGVPVLIGLRWPNGRVFSGFTLNKQPPHRTYSHAVTLVGYSTESGKLDDIRFVLRNSWGTQWGVGGYGYVTLGYLRANLLAAVVVEMRTPGS